MSNPNLSAVLDVMEAEGQFLSPEARRDFEVLNGERLSQIDPVIMKTISENTLRQARFSHLRPPTPVENPGNLEAIASRANAFKVTLRRSGAGYEPVDLSSGYPRHIPEAHPLRGYAPLPSLGGHVQQMQAATAPPDGLNPLVIIPKRR